MYTGNEATDSSIRVHFCILILIHIHICIQRPRYPALAGARWASVEDQLTTPAPYRAAASPRQRVTPPTVHRSSLSSIPAPNCRFLPRHCFWGQTSSPKNLAKYSQRRITLSDQTQPNLVSQEWQSGVQSWCYRKANNRRGSETESSNAGVAVKTAVTALSSIWGQRISENLRAAFFCSI